MPTYPNNNSAELLRELIRLPSVNPMGRTDLAGAESTSDVLLEGRMTAYLCEWFSRQGISCTVQAAAPGRSNVVAWTDGRPDLPAVLLDAHQDTVPVEGMTIEPFSADLRDGRIWGRGACDIKGGMACMLTAMAKVHNQSDKPRIVMSCTCDEELGQLGARTLTACWQDGAGSQNGGERLPEGIPARPDLAIVAEPTSLDVVVAHRGTCRWRIVASGKAAHSSQPDRGISAIYRMSSIVQALEEYAGLLATRVPQHSLCGPATLSVGRIEGGTSVNIVPDWCAIDIDRRVLPAEIVDELLVDAKQFVQSRVDFEFDMQPPTSGGLPLDNSNNGPFAELLGRSIESVTGGQKAIGVAYTTHAPRFAATGMPTVVFGPGSIEQAHTKDEWIEVDQMDKATEILIHFLTHLVPGTQ
jgi:acetylornithine deacetylase